MDNLIQPRHYRNGIIFAFRVLIALVSSALFYYVYLTFYKEATFFYKGNFVFGMLYVLVLTILLSTYGGYKIGTTGIRDLMFSFLISTLFANIIMYFVMSLIAEKLLPLLPVTLTMLGQWLIALLLYIIAGKVYNKLFLPVPAALVTSKSHHDLSTKGKFSRANSRFNVVYTIDSRIGYDEIVQILNNYECVVLGDIDYNLRKSLMEYGFENRKQVIVIPSMHDIMLSMSNQVILRDSLLYYCKIGGFTTERLIIKRIADVFIASLMLLVASPFMLLTALAIKLCDGGPVFFRQERLTRNGKHFSILKFRSMVVDAERINGPCKATKRDPRITPVGRFIRATRIDELPQLINVLSGEMSLVGPRPCPSPEFEAVCKVFPQFAYRLRVKAGLTGYAQLYGRYGTESEDKVRMDLYYIENASLLLDLKLLFYTLKIVFMKESSEGVDDNEY